jgi:hypothetical protein
MRRHREDKSTRQVLALAAFMAGLSQLTLAEQVPPRRLPSEFGDAKDPKQAYTRIENLAKDAVSQDANIGRNRVSISNGILAYDFRPASQDILASRPDRLTSPLEILIRAEALERDFRLYTPSESFWVRPLDQLRKLAAEMVDAAYEVASEDEWRGRKQEYESEVGSEMAVLAKELLAYADNSGLDAKATKGSVQGYHVEIRIDPPRAHVKYMPFLNYKRCIAFKLDLKDYWLDLNAGKQTLIGKYHYLAEWPPSLNGPDDGNFEVTEEGMMLTFQPRGN